MLEQQCVLDRNYGSHSEFRCPCFLGRWCRQMCCSMRCLSSTVDWGQTGIVPFLSEHRLTNACNRTVYLEQKKNACNGYTLALYGINRESGQILLIGWLRYANVIISVSSNWKSKSSKFSFMWTGSRVRGLITMFCCKCQRSKACAGVFPCFWAIAVTFGCVRTSGMGFHEGPKLSAWSGQPTGE